MKEFIQFKTVSGEPIQVEQTTLTPETQVLQISFPFGGFVWNRPTAVTVERYGQVETIPIQDVTRLVMWTAVGLTVFVNLVIILTMLTKRR